MDPKKVIYVKIKWLFKSVKPLKKAGCMWDCNPVSLLETVTDSHAVLGAEVEDWLLADEWVANHYICIYSFTLQV